MFSLTRYPFGPSTSPPPLPASSSTFSPGFSVGSCSVAMPSASSAYSTASCLVLDTFPFFLLTLGDIFRPELLKIFLNHDDICPWSEENFDCVPCARANFMHTDCTDTATSLHWDQIPHKINSDAPGVWSLIKQPKEWGIYIYINLVTYRWVWTMGIPILHSLRPTKIEILKPGWKIKI